MPQPPTALPKPASITNDMDKTQKFKLFREKLQYRRKKAEMYSLWCDCLYRLSLANHVSIVLPVLAALMRDKRP